MLAVTIPPLPSTTWRRSRSSSGRLSSLQDKCRWRVSDVGGNGTGHPLRQLARAGGEGLGIVRHQFRVQTGVTESHTAQLPAEKFEPADGASSRASLEPPKFWRQPDRPCYSPTRWPEPAETRCFGVPQPQPTRLRSLTATGWRGSSIWPTGYPFRPPTTRHNSPWGTDIRCRRNSTSKRKDPVSREH